MTVRVITSEQHFVTVITAGTSYHYGLALLMHNTNSLQRRGTASCSRPQDEKVIWLRLVPRRVTFYLEMHHSANHALLSHDDHDIIVATCNALLAPFDLSCIAHSQAPPSFTYADRPRSEAACKQSKIF